MSLTERAGLKISRTIVLGTGIALLVGVMALAMTVAPPRQTPYAVSVLALKGNAAQGKNIFEGNCSACHGLHAEGKVGPNLHQVSKRRTDESLITQVVSGQTPPMPRFQLEPQQMADLLAHLKTL
jgi:mono/diheme cytochrome c family protein